VGGIALERPGDGSGCIRSPDPELAGSARVRERRLRESSFGLARARGQAIGHEGPAAAPALDETGRLELAVRACHGVRRERELGREVADGRQPLPREEAAALDPHGERVAQLRRERHPGGPVESDLHNPIMRRA
jgi:hypothetical protein